MANVDTDGEFYIPLSENHRQSPRNRQLPKMMVPNLSPVWYWWNSLTDEQRETALRRLREHRPPVPLKECPTCGQPS